MGVVEAAPLRRWDQSDARGTVSPGTSPQTFWFKPDSIFGLLRFTALQRFTWVDLATRSWLPYRLMLAVAARAYAGVCPS